MKDKLITGIVIGVVGALTYKMAYKKGHKDGFKLGVGVCDLIVKTALEAQEAVAKGEKESQ